MLLAVVPTQPTTAISAPQRGNAAKRVRDYSLPPWKTDAEWHGLARWERAVKFIELYCRSPKGYGFGVPLKLAPFQKRFLKAVLADGIEASVLTTPRGNGKSTFGGALAVWAVFDDDQTGAPQVPIVATKIKQAERSCYAVAVAMVAAEPELAKRSIPYTAIGDKRLFVPFNGGELFPTANDIEGLQGLDFSFALFDEIGFQQRESWDALRQASGKRPRSLIVGVGTRGIDRHNALHHLIATVHEGSRIPGFVLHEYSASEDRTITDPATWAIANPAIRAGFLRKSALALDLRLTTEGQFRIFRLNQAWDGVDSWLGSDGRKIWNELAQPYEFVDKAPTWVGVDVGIKRDSTAVVSVQRDAAGQLHAQCKLWVPTGDDAVDVTDVMQHIRDLAKRYDVQAVSYDPRFFDVPAKMLSDERLKMLEIPQSVERMTSVVGSLLEVIKRGEVHYDPADDYSEALATHVLNAVPRNNERGFTLQKSKSRGKIDAVIALALAVDRALHAKPKRRAMAAGF